MPPKRTFQIREPPGGTKVPPYPLLSESYKGGVRGTVGSLS